MEMECKSNSENLIQCLKTWVSNEKSVPHSSVDRLLLLLHDHFDVPKSVKSLLDPKCYKMFEMHNGQYVHFNWKEALKFQLESNPYLEDD